LHHFPYFGMRGEEDAANLAEAGNTTNRLYEKEFGEGVSRRAAYCSVAKPAYCSVAVTAEKAAYCSVAKPAYCSVAVTAEKAAYCSVAKPAYCSVAVTAEKSAYCSVAVTGKKAAYCSVAANDGGARGVQRDKLNTSLRPTLALAA